MQLCKKGQSRVVQKYIEQTFLLPGKIKFDIRQWVLVTSWDPLEAYVFDSAYLRLCSSEFSLDEISNVYRHLSNYSIQKHGDSAPEMKKQGYCMSISEFEGLVNRGSGSGTPRGQP
mmetsp:Transcript_37132/g.56984  ORF Transcript_37132/g.56984 Transcript_37132/m.56984 type:complete len:116 (+) Transcript_37132:702-1049(+)